MVVDVMVGVMVRVLCGYGGCVWWWVCYVWVWGGEFSGGWVVCVVVSVAVIRVCVCGDVGDSVVVCC